MFDGKKVKELEEKIRTYETKDRIREQEYRQILEDDAKMKKAFKELTEGIRLGGETASLVGGLHAEYGEFMLPLISGGMFNKKGKQNSAIRSRKDEGDEFLEAKNRTLAKYTILDSLVREGLGGFISPISLQAAVYVRIDNLTPFEAVKKARTEFRDVLDAYNMPQINSGIRELYQRLGLSL